MVTTTKSPRSILNTFEVSTENETVSRKQDDHHDNLFDEWKLRSEHLEKTHSRVLQNKIKKLEDENRALKRIAFSQDESKDYQINSLKEELSDVSATNAKLDAENTQMTESLRNHEEYHEQAEERMDHLENELFFYQDLVKTLKQELSDISGKNAELKAENTEMKQSIQSHEEYHEQAEERMDCLEKEMSTNEDLVKALKKDLSDISIKNKNLRKIIREIKSIYDSQCKKYTEMAILINATKNDYSGVCENDTCVRKIENIDA